MFQYFLYKFGLFIIHRLPRRWAYALAEWVSEQQFLRSQKDRTAVMNNLRQITGSEDGVYEMAREAFHHFGRYLVDFFLMDRTVDERFVKENVTVRGRENLDQAIIRGKGVIMLTAHIGNWEMGAAVMGRMGFPLHAIALPHKERRVNELFNRQREHYGVTVVPMNTAVRRCVEALRGNKFVALLGDRDFGTFGEPLMFLGRTTLIPKGAAFFAMKTGATILPSFIRPLGDGRFELLFHAPIIPPEGPEVDEPIAALSMVRQYAAIIESEIKRTPTQWLMFREFGIENENNHIDAGVQRVRKNRSSR